MIEIVLNVQKIQRSNEKKKLQKVIVKIGIRMKRNTRQRNAYTHVQCTQPTKFNFIFNYFQQIHGEKNKEKY